MHAHVGRCTCIHGGVHVRRCMCINNVYVDKRYPCTCPCAEGALEEAIGTKLGGGNWGHTRCVDLCNGCRMGVHTVWRKHTATISLHVYATHHRMCHQLHKRTSSPRYNATGVAGRGRPCCMAFFTVTVGCMMVTSMTPDAAPIAVASNAVTVPCFDMMCAAALQDNVRFYGQRCAVCAATTT